MFAYGLRLRLGVILWKGLTILLIPILSLNTTLTLGFHVPQIQIALSPPSLSCYVLSSELQRHWNDTLIAEFWSLCGGWRAGHPQSFLTIKHYNIRVLFPYMAAPSGHKFGFTQSYGTSYGGIVAVFIEFTGPLRPARRPEGKCTTVNSLYINIYIWNANSQS